MRVSETNILSLFADQKASEAESFLNTENLEDLISKLAYFQNQWSHCLASSHCNSLAPNSTATMRAPPQRNVWTNLGTEQYDSAGWMFSVSTIYAPIAYGIIMAEMHKVFSSTDPEKENRATTLIDSPPFFYISTLIFLLAKLALLAIPLAQRAAPIEPDDAYAYIQRAAQIEYCTFSECLALEDIRAQVELQNSDPTIVYQSGHLRHRTFPNIYPLYSLLIFSGHKLNLSWEASYSTISALGILFLGVAISALLKELFGYGVAGLSLILLGPYIFQSDMLHTGSPHAWAMAAGMFAWALILRRDKFRKYLVPVLLAVSILFHPVGTLFAVLSSVFVVFLDYKNKANRHIFLWGMIVAISAIAIPAIVPGNGGLASEVLVGARPNSFFDFQILLDNIAVARAALSTWANSFWNLWVVALLSLAGYALLKNDQRKRFGVLWVLLGSLLGASVLGSLVSRGFPPDLFARLLVPFGVLTVGLIATVILDLFKRIPSFFRCPVNKWEAGRFIVTGFLIFLAMLSNVKHDLRHYPLTLQTRIDRGNILLDRSQPDSLNLLGGSEVIYGDEVILHYYFLNGGFSHGAAYYPILVGAENRVPWFPSNSEFVYIAGRNPISRSDFSAQGGLRIMQGDILCISNETGFPNEIQLLLQTGDSLSTLTSTQISMEGVVIAEATYELQAEFSGWIIVSEINPRSEKINLSISGSDNPVTLLGVRLDPGSSLNWPWDTGLSIQFTKEAREITFKTDELFPLLGGHVGILFDKGDYFLAKVLR